MSQGAQADCDGGGKREAERGAGPVRHVLALFGSFPRGLKNHEKYVKHDVYAGAGLRMIAGRCSRPMGSQIGAVDKRTPKDHQPLQKKVFTQKKKAGLRPSPVVLSS